MRVCGSITSVVVVFCLIGLVVGYNWPPAPPVVGPVRGQDIPGSDIGGMPINLTSNDPEACADLCRKTANCRAYSYGVPNCGGIGPNAECWLKFHANLPSTPNACRAYGTTATACQLPTQWTNQVNPQNPLPEYPRPQLERHSKSWKNLNGLWEFQFVSQSTPPPFGQRLNGSILVPFPAESCLSGVGKTGMYMYYRQVIKNPFTSPRRVFLHFGAVDWQATVYMNRINLGSHTGGYSGFSFDVTRHLQTGDNEIIVFVHDPSNYGSQPYGKQRIGAIANPGGDTYTPNSGIWQTVWLEEVPTTYIDHIKLTPTLNSITMNFTVGGPYNANTVINVKIEYHSTTYQATLRPGVPGTVQIQNPQHWTPDQPNIYNFVATLDSDSVQSYFALRTFSIGTFNGITRPLLNNQFVFLAGWLDQSFWPDGIYTAPTDEALRFDLQAVKHFGLNFVRLHQKVNPERWYYYADHIGIVVQQDAVQHYGNQHGVRPNFDYYFNDLKAMIDDRYNHPCIVQWTAFNEGDMVGNFNTSTISGVVNWIKRYDPSRTVDTDSGGPANNLYIGDVNDIHTYPVPGDPKPSRTQYAEVGEYGGLGWFVNDHMWAQGLCGSYLTLPTQQALADRIEEYAGLILGNKRDISIAVYTQITDVENECDGYYNYDRTVKFNQQQISALYNANQKLIHSTV